MTTDHGLLTTSCPLLRAARSGRFQTGARAVGRGRRAQFDGACGWRPDATGITANESLACLSSLAARGRARLTHAAHVAHDAQYTPEGRDVGSQAPVEKGVADNGERADDDQVLQTYSSLTAQRRSCSAPVARVGSAAPGSTGSVSAIRRFSSAPLRACPS